MRSGWGERSWTRPHRNTDEVTEDLTTNSEITIKNGRNSCVFAVCLSFASLT